MHTAWTVRYAVKACPAAGVIRILNRAGLHIDASSGYEALRAMRTGVPATQIQLTTQQLPDNLADLVRQGVLFNACSLHQLAAYGRLFPGREVSVRINPGLGSGHSNRTNTGGPSSSFGIWHEHLDQVLATAAEHKPATHRLAQPYRLGQRPSSLAALRPTDVRSGCQAARGPAREYGRRFQNWAHGRRSIDRLAQGRPTCGR